MGKDWFDTEESAYAGYWGVMMTVVNSKFGHSASPVDDFCQEVNEIERLLCERFDAGLGMQNDKLDKIRVRIEAAMEFTPGGFTAAVCAKDRLRVIVDRFSLSLSIPSADSPGKTAWTAMMMADGHQKESLLGMWENILIPSCRERWEKIAAAVNPAFRDLPNQPGWWVCNIDNKSYSMMCFSDKESINQAVRIPKVTYKFIADLK